MSFEPMAQHRNTLRIAKNVPWPRSLAGGLGQTYDISLDPRAAFKYSAILWCGIAAFISSGAALAGVMESWVDWLVVVLGLSCSVIIAGLLYLTFGMANGRPRGLAWLLISGAILACAALQTGADYATQFLDHALTPGPGGPDMTLWGAFRLGFVYVSLYAANAALMQVAFAGRRLREQEVAIARQDAEAAQSELRILRIQLNPHFMFNALSALIGLQQVGRHGDAILVTEKLADFMRAAVDIDAGQEIALVDELSVLDAYLAVEMVRFGDRLKVEIECASDVERAMLPNMLLQPLVENAMKYAVEPSTAPVTVSIKASRNTNNLRLEVADRGKVLRADPSSNAGLGFGLDATRSRLRLAYGDRAMMMAVPSSDGFAVTIELPLLTAAE